MMIPNVSSNVRLHSPTFVSKRIVKETGLHLFYTWPAMIARPTHPPQSKGNCGEETVIQCERGMND